LVPTDDNQAWYYGEITYILTTTFLRLAVGAFLLRVAVRRLHRTVVYACLGVNIIFNIYYLTFTVIQCSPIDGFWRRFGGEKDVTCHPDIAVISTFVSSGLSAVIDWVFGLLPVFILWDLNVGTRKKVALGLIMGMGAVYVHGKIYAFWEQMLITIRSASTAPIVRIPYTATLGASHDFLCKLILKRITYIPLIIFQGKQRMSQSGVA
jgi:hypothetical protein